MGALYALASSVLYGVADFAGGLLSRRAPFAVVALLGQVSGMVLMLVVTPLLPGEPGAVDLAWGALSGVGTGGGMVLLYRGLSRGAMSVVVPVCAVGGLAIPVLVGVAVLGDRPTVPAVAGMVLAAPALWLTVPRAGGQGGGVADGLLASVFIAVQYLALALAGPAAGMWPILAGRVTATLTVLPLAWRELSTGRPVTPRNRRSSTLEWKAGGPRVPGSCPQPSDGGGRAGGTSSLRVAAPGNPTTEPTTSDVGGTPPGSANDPPTRTANDLTTKSAGGPPARTGTEPPARSTSEPAARTASDPTTRSANEPPAQPTTEPPAQAASSPPAQTTTEPPAQAASSPPARTANEPPTRSANEPQAQAATERTANPPARKTPARVLVGAAVTGACATLALVAYLLATRAQLLSIAVVLSSLYPAIPVLLGLTVLRERLDLRQTTGLLGAAAAIVLLTLG